MLTMNWTGSAGVRTIGIATVLVMALTGCTGGDQDVAEPAPETAAPTSAAASPSPSPEGASEYSPEEEAAIEAATGAVRRFYEVSDAAAADPEAVDAKVFDGVAIDPVRTDQLGALGYFFEEGQHQVGRISVEIAQVNSVETASDPEKFVYPEVYLDICVDTSDAHFVDKAGKTVPTDMADRQAAVIGAYEEPGEGWLVSFLEYQGGGEACA